MDGVLSKRQSALNNLCKLKSKSQPDMPETADDDEYGKFRSSNQNLQDYRSAQINSEFDDSSSEVTTSSETCEQRVNNEMYEECNQDQMTSGGEDVDEFEAVYGNINLNGRSHHQQDIKMAVKFLYKVLKSHDLEHYLADLVDIGFYSPFLIDKLKLTDLDRINVSPYDKKKFIKLKFFVKQIIATSTSRGKTPSSINFEQMLSSFDAKTTMKQVEEPTWNQRTGGFKMPQKLDSSKPHSVWHAKQIAPPPAKKTNSHHGAGFFGPKLAVNSHHTSGTSKQITETKVNYNYGVPSNSSSKKKSGIKHQPSGFIRKTYTPLVAPSSRQTDSVSASRPVVSSQQSKAEILVYARKRPKLPSEANFNDVICIDNNSDRKVADNIDLYGSRLKSDSSTRSNISSSRHKNNMICVDELKSAVDGTPILRKNEFIFDRTFDSLFSNEDIFKSSIWPFVTNDFDHNKSDFTCICFGQTGSGKTHTLFGNNKQQEDGLCILTAKNLFASNEKILCGFYEIYNGQLYDLINKHNKLILREDANGQVNVVGLLEVEIRNLTQLRKTIETGQANRHIGCTSFNKSSSRSHAVLQFKVPALESGQRGAGSSKPKPYGSSRVFSSTKPAQLFNRILFIDLAGSERGIDAQNNLNDNRKEGAEINQSLLALKECIRCIDQFYSHAPFRQSKLTRVLRDCFIGNGKTVLIATVSPTEDCVSCSLNTLQYANRVRQMTLRSRSRSEPRHQTLVPYVADEEPAPNEIRSPRKKSQERRSGETEKESELLNEAFLAHLTRMNTLNNAALINRPSSKSKLQADVDTKSNRRTQAASFYNGYSDTSNKEESRTSSSQIKQSTSRDELASIKKHLEETKQLIADTESFTKSSMAHNDLKYNISLAQRPPSSAIMTNQPARDSFENNAVKKSSSSNIFHPSKINMSSTPVKPSQLHMSPKTTANDVDNGQFLFEHDTPIKGHKIKCMLNEQNKLIKLAERYFPRNESIQPDVQRNMPVKATPTIKTSTIEQQQSPILNKAVLSSRSAHSPSREFQSQSSLPFSVCAPTASSLEEKAKLLVHLDKNSFKKEMLRSIIGESLNNSNGIKANNVSSLNKSKERMSDDFKSSTFSLLHDESLKRLREKQQSFLKSAKKFSLNNTSAISSSLDDLKILDECRKDNTSQFTGEQFYDEQTQETTSAAADAKDSSLEKYKCVANSQNQLRIYIQNLENKLNNLRNEMRDNSSSVQQHRERASMSSSLDSLLEVKTASSRIKANRETSPPSEETKRAVYMESTPYNEQKNTLDELEKAFLLKNSPDKLLVDRYNKTVVDTADTTFFSKSFNQPNVSSLQEPSCNKNKNFDHFSPIELKKSPNSVTNADKYQNSMVVSAQPIQLVNPKPIRPISLTSSSTTSTTSSGSFIDTNSQQPAASSLLSSSSRLKSHQTEMNSNSKIWRAKSQSSVWSGAHHEPTVNSSSSLKPTEQIDTSSSRQIHQSLLADCIKENGSSKGFEGYLNKIQDMLAKKVEAIRDLQHQLKVNAIDGTQIG